MQASCCKFIVTQGGIWRTTFTDININFHIAIQFLILLAGDLQNVLNSGVSLVVVKFKFYYYSFLALHECMLLVQIRCKMKVKPKHPSIVFFALYGNRIYNSYNAYSHYYV